MEDSKSTTTKRKEVLTKDTVIKKAKDMVINLAMRSILLVIRNMVPKLENLVTAHIHQVVVADMEVVDMEVVDMEDIKTLKSLLGIPNQFSQIFSLFIIKGVYV